MKEADKRGDTWWVRGEGVKRCKLSEEVHFKTSLAPNVCGERTP